MSTPAYYTEEGLKKLQDELHRMKTVDRPHLSQQIADARDKGDLSENAEYHAAKEEKSKMEARIAKLHGILEKAVIVEGGGSEAVRSGSVVTLRYDGDDEDEAERYLVGSIEERHDDLHVVSPTSPLGSALIGAKPGDSVTYDAPNGSLTVVVVDIE